MADKKKARNGERRFVAGPINQPTNQKQTKAVMILLKQAMKTISDSLMLRKDTKVTDPKYAPGAKRHVDDDVVADVLQKRRIKKHVAPGYRYRIDRDFFDRHIGNAPQEIQADESRSGADTKDHAERVPSLKVKQRAGDKKTEMEAEAPAN